MGWSHFLRNLGVLFNRRSNLCVGCGLVCGAGGGGFSRWTAVGCFEEFHRRERLSGFGRGWEGGRMYSCLHGRRRSVSRIMACRVVMREIEGAIHLRGRPVNIFNFKGRQT
jgi:hypothetical protein